MENKKFFEKPNMSIVLFSDEDVIATSTPGLPGGNYGDDPHDEYED